MQVTSLQKILYKQKKLINIVEENNFKNISIKN